LKTEWEEQPESLKIKETRKGEEIKIRSKRYRYTDEQQNEVRRTNNNSTWMK
jgi:hypothetical protein